MGKTTPLNFTYQIRPEDLEKLERYCRTTFNCRLETKMAQLHQDFFDKAMEHIRSAEILTGLDYLKI